MNPGTLDVTAMREVNAAPRPEGTDDGGKIVLGVCGERSSAKGDAVGGIVYDIGHTLERRAAGDDSRQPKDRPGRIIRMERHAHTRRRRDRDDALQEVRKIVPECVLVHRAVSLE